MIRGRPLHFLATVLAGWVAIRLAMTLPLPADAVETPFLLDHRRRPGPSFVAMFPDSPAAVDHKYPVTPLAFTGPKVGSVELFESRPSPNDILEERIAFAPSPASPAHDGYTATTDLSPREKGVPPARAVAAGRWSGAAWMIARREGPVDRPLLAGSQAGVRLDYAFAAGSPLRPALYGRASAALNAPAAAEIAIGIALRPRLPVPLTLALERRQAVSPGGRNDFALLVAGGLVPTAIGAGLRVEGYGQAGLVGLGRRDAFIDGRLTVERAVVGSPIAIGAAAWGGAQPGTSRLDLGPQASIRVRAGRASLRIGAEWRERVAGNASPASGPALSIGMDF